MHRLLKAPVFEPATPSQLSTIAAFPGRKPDSATGDNGLPSIMTSAMAVEIRSGDALEAPGFGGMEALLSPAASRLSAVHSEL